MGKTLKEKIAERRRKMDEASGFATPKPKKKKVTKKKNPDYKPPNHGKRKQ